MLFMAAFVSGACTSGAKVNPTQPNEEASAKLIALEGRIDDIDSRLQKIEALLRQAMGGDQEQPDPNVVYSVPTKGFPYVGAEHAKVTIVKAYEFACGYCYRVRDTLERITRTYGDDVKIVYKPYIVHAEVAVLPAMAVCAADKQGKFTEMTDLIWEKGFAERDLGEEKITSLAQSAGLDMTRYRADVESAECLESLRASVANLGALGVNGTPSFYINGRILVGAQPFEAFKELIDEELSKANTALASGTRLQDYYQNVVVDGGKTEI